MNAPLEPHRGEVFTVQGLAWPALVIQNDTGNKFSPTTIVALLSEATDRPYPFTTPITAKASGLPKGGIINLAFIMTVDTSRLVKKIGKLGVRRMAKVDAAIKVSLGLPQG